MSAWANLLSCPREHSKEEYHNRLQFLIYKDYLCKYEHKKQKFKSNPTEKKIKYNETNFELIVNEFDASFSKLIFENIY